MGKLIASILWAALVMSVPAQADINKCKNPDGSLYYTDKQCPADSRLEESIAKKPANIPANTSSKFPEIVNFGDGIYQQFSKAQSIVKMAAVEGRNCEWSITVKGNALDCVKFMGVIVEGGAYSQAVTKIIALPEEDKNKELSTSDFNEVLADVKKVVKYKNYMLTSMGIN